MKKLQLFILLACALFFSSCAMSRIDNNTRDITYHNRTNIVNYGAEHAKIIGPVFLETNAKCSDIDFFKNANGKDPRIDDIINVKMEEYQSAATRSYSCKYSGLAVSYESLSVEEAAEWHAVGDSAVFLKNEGKEGKPQIVEPSRAPVIWGILATVVATVMTALFINTK